MADTKNGVKTSGSAPKGNGISGWASAHPWMTFFLASGLVSGIVTAIGGNNQTR